MGAKGEHYGKIEPSAKDLKSETSYKTTIKIGKLFELQALLTTEVKLHQSNIWVDILFTKLKYTV
jgi:hypothetical protein